MGERTDEQNRRLAALPRWKDKFISGQVCSVEEIEEFSVARYKEDNAITGENRIPEVPFGFVNAAWELFKSRMQPGDEIQFYRSDRKSWEQQAGREGFLLIRGGKQIASIVTSMS